MQFNYLKNAIQSCKLCNLFYKLCNLIMQIMQFIHTYYALKLCKLCNSIMEIMQFKYSTTRSAARGCPTSEVVFEHWTTEDIEKCTSLYMAGIFNSSNSLGDYPNSSRIKTIPVNFFWIYFALRTTPSMNKYMN